MGLRIIDRMSSPDTGGRQNVDRENPPSSARRQNRETGIPGICEDKRGTVIFMTVPFKNMIII